MRLLITSILFLVTIFLSFWNFFPRGNSGPAALQVFSKPDSTPVYLNDQQVGVTPYQTQQLEPGEVKLTVGTGAASFSKIVKLTAGVFTVVNRELSDNLFLQAGETLNLEPGTGLTVLSTPDNASVEVDDKKVGKTPLNLNNLQPGEHKVVISKEDFVARAIEIRTHDNYRLILNVTLSANPQGLAQTQTQTVVQQVKVRVSSTPTGWLRVREAPSFGGGEIARVNTGEEYQLLEEQPDWAKIKLPDGREGWVSSQFVEKL